MSSNNVTINVAYALALIANCERRIDVATIVTELPLAYQPVLAISCASQVACRRWVATVLKLVDRDALERLIGRTEVRSLYYQFM